MQQCAEERRRLAAEWSRFHSQEREQQTRAERQASHALEREANREAAIISMAQVPPLGGRQPLSAWHSYHHWGGGGEGVYVGGVCGCMWCVCVCRVFPA